MFMYRSFTFVLNSATPFDERPSLVRLFKKCTAFIAERDGYCTGCMKHMYSHYHGYVGYDENFESFINIMFLEVEGYCRIFEDEDCPTPLGYLFQIRATPQDWFYRIIPADIDEYFYNNISPVNRQNVADWDKEKKRKLDLAEKFKSLIMSSRMLGCNTLISEFVKDKDLLSLLTPNDLDCFESALSKANKTVCEKSIVDLCKDFAGDANDYLTGEESKDYVITWCTYQQISPARFANDWVTCMDRKLKNKNTLYLHGAETSDIAYITASILDACVFSYSLSDRAASHESVLSCAVKQRMISMTNPCFEKKTIELMLKILEGTPTYILSDADHQKWFRRTPVVITCNKHVWSDKDLESKLNDRFVQSYKNLRGFSNGNKKKLHPSWLPKLARAEYVSPVEFPVPRASDSRVHIPQVEQPGSSTFRRQLQQTVNQETSNHRSIKQVLKEAVGCILDPKDDHAKKNPLKRKRLFDDI